MRGRTIPVVCVLLGVVIAGCGGPMGTEAAGPFEDPDRRDLVDRIRASLPEDTGAAFERTMTEDGGVTPTGEAFLERLARIERLGPGPRDAVAASVAERGSIDGDVIARLDRLLASPVPFQQTVFAAGLADRSGDGLLDGEALAFGLAPSQARPRIATLADALRTDGYNATEIAYLARVAQLRGDRFAWAQTDAVAGFASVEASGTVGPADLARLADTSGDGLLDGMGEQLGLPPADAHEAVVAVARPLAAHGYSTADIGYLDRVATLSTFQGHPYEGWAQATHLALFERAVEDGRITEGERWRIGNDDGDRLLNGMERDFGTDPARADTSGDGYADHLTWGPMRDLGLDVHPTHPDVFVEVDTTENVSFPTSDQYHRIQETLRTEPPEDVGPIRTHFLECSTGVEPVETMAEARSRVEAHRAIRGLGVHYLLLNDGDFAWLGDRWSGVAWLGHWGEPFMLVRGDRRPARVTSLIAHELGHKLGIRTTDFAGVNSTEYGFQKYHSVMNYNRTDEITYSTGPPFNDYEQMARMAFGSGYESTGRLEAMWEAGNTPDGPLC